jgi:hypothetical protein
MARDNLGEGAQTMRQTNFEKKIGPCDLRHYAKGHPPGQ